MANAKIREQLRISDIKHWQLAEKLNIAESTLCKRLRKEFSDTEKVNLRVKVRS